MPVAPKHVPRLRLRCFGVGDGWPSAERGHSSFLYQFGQGAVLVDCGEPASRAFKASGLSYELIDEIFLSHLHFDHAGGFFMLVQGFWLEGRKRKLIVRAPADGITPLREMLLAGCLLPELLPFELAFEPLVASKRIQAGKVQVTPFPTTHLANLRRSFRVQYRKEFIAFSFLIESGGLRIAHSADIGAAADLAPLLARPVDLLVCELAHVGPQELFEFLAGRPIGRIAFVHLSRECRRDLAALQRKAKKMLAPIPVSFPSDNEELTLRPASDSG